MQVKINVICNNGLPLFNLQCDWQNKESIHAKLNILLLFLGGYSLRASYISTLPIEYNSGPVLQCM